MILFNGHLWRIKGFIFTSLHSCRFENLSKNRNFGCLEYEAKESDLRQNVRISLHFTRDGTSALNFKYICAGYAKFFVEFLSSVLIISFPLPSTPLRS